MKWFGPVIILASILINTWYFWVTCFLWLWPAHREFARESIAETFIGWAFYVLPTGPRKLEFAEWIVKKSWLGHVHNDNTLSTRVACRNFMENKDA